jgi:hypothetical protein
MSEVETRELVLVEGNPVAKTCGQSARAVACSAGCTVMS